MLTDFQKFFTIQIFNKIHVILPHFRGVTPLPCKTQKTETGKIMQHVGLTQ